MSEFTKGKWIYDDESNYIFNDDKQMTIAQIRGWGYLTQKLGLSDDEAYEVQQTNARLIAAAPEMFKLLSCCYEIVPNYYEKKIGELLERITGKEA